MDALQSLRVFLSYARVDRARVTKLADALSAAGLRVWWDKAIEGGSAFAKDIARELDAADVVVVVWSAASVESAWVLDEAGAGRDRKRLVPVQIDATLPPLGFRQLQSVDLAGWRGRAGDPKLSALVATITKVAGNAASAPPPATPKSGAARRFAAWLVAAMLLIAATGAGWRFLRPGAAGAARPIVAVLPFTDMSEARGKAYFAEGIAEEILDTLAQDKRLKVLGGNTARAISNNSADPGFARDKLGVTRLLEGSVRRGVSANTVKVSVRLIDTADGSEIWSKVFDRSGADVAAVQEEVAQAVALQLAGPLGGNAQIATASAAKVPPAAYEKLLVARQLLRTGQLESILRARALATEAVALAPDHALAYAVKSLATTKAAAYAALPPGAEADARRDAETAVKIDPNLSDGFTALGFAIVDSGRHEEAIGALKRALALKPDNVEARALLGREYLQTGDVNRAQAELAKAAAADPLWLNPTAYYIFSASLGLKLDQARVAAARFRAISPDPAEADLVDFGKTYIVGDYARALAHANAALARNPKLTPARYFKFQALTAMFAFDRVSDAEWAIKPPFYRRYYSDQPQEAARMVLTNGASAWDDQLQVVILTFGLDAATLVRAFDARFANVGTFLASPVAAQFRAENAWLYLAAAFDRVGRQADALLLRKAARARMTYAEANGLAPSNNAVTWAMLLLAEGDREGALTRLERGTAAAWWLVCNGFPRIGNQKPLASLNGDPRFEAIKGRCRAEINKQRKLAGIAPPLLN